ncbi:MAG: Uma2 family endonuclease [Chloroflexota bacterium]
MDSVEKTNQIEWVEAPDTSKNGHSTPHTAQPDSKILGYEFIKSMITHNQSSLNGHKEDAYPYRTVEYGVALDDPFRYGWRYVEDTMIDGTIETKRIPLTPYDLLHPQEDDYRVQNLEHKRYCNYVGMVLETHITQMPLPDHYLLDDARIDFGLPDVEPIGPDIVLMCFVYDRYSEPHKGTVYVGRDGDRPELVIEVTSPSTRQQDFNEKPWYMQQAQISYYVVVDVVPPIARRRVYGYALTADGYYVGIQPNEQGWVWLEPVGLWIGLNDGAVECYDAEGNLMLDHTAQTERADAEQRRADEEQRRADEEQRRADLAEAESQRMMAYLRSLGIDPATIPPMSTDG